MGDNAETAGVPSDERLMEVTELLISMTSQIDAKGFIHFDKHRISHPVQAAATYILAKHVSLLVKPALDAFESGEPLRGMVNLRAAYEMAVTAQWVALRREAYRGLVNESARQHANIKRRLSESPSQFLQSVAAGDYPRAERVIGPSGADTGARNFGVAADELVMGHDAYVYYGLLSDYCHPSVALMDCYVEEDAGPSGLSFTSEAMHDRVQPFLFFLPFSMLLALSAVDHLEARSPRAAELDSYAKELGLTRMMKLRPEIVQADFEGDRAFRRSRWKGPKPRHATAEGEGES